MRILMCNGFYYLRGGSEKYMFELTKLLQSHGHEVIPFSMKHRLNISSAYEDYFVSTIDYPSLLSGETSISAIIKSINRLIYSKEAKFKIRKLINDTRPDIAHIHGIGHELSPSILDEIKSNKIPIVQTLHDYSLVCPNTNFVSNGKICEACKGGRYYQIIIKKCKRNSMKASGLACLIHYIRKITRIYERNIDIYISPSKFLKNKLLDHGVKKEIVYIPNFLNQNDIPQDGKSQNYCVYAGRLHPIKGITTLIHAAEKYQGNIIYIAGDGESRFEIEELIKYHQLDHVQLLGHLPGKELFEIISNSSFTVLPSECYENYPMSIVESFAIGKPVIASNIGAIPDLVRDGWNGLLFEPKNADQLAGKMKYLFDHPELAKSMGLNGKNSVSIENSPDRHYQQIYDLYNRLINQEGCPSI